VTTIRVHADQYRRTNGKYYPQDMVRNWRRPQKSRNLLRKALGD
jgi:hypothetical protein